MEGSDAYQVRRTRSAAETAWTNEASVLVVTSPRRWLQESRADGLSRGHTWIVTRPFIEAVSGIGMPMGTNTDPNPGTVRRPFSGKPGQARCAFKTKS